MRIYSTEIKQIVSGRCYPQHMKNQTLIQYFHWYYHEEDQLWVKVAKASEALAGMGITGIWLPPAYKASGGEHAMGYDIYDLFDLGEFDQKGAVATRWGTKTDYLKAIQALQEHGIGVIADVVFNHKAGGDELEKMMVRRVDPENREAYTSESFEIEAWTRFTFPGRKGQYSDFIWDKYCFSGVDWAENLGETGIFSIQNEEREGWEEVPSTEFGNYDYLMFNDIDFRNNAVRDELKRWGNWYEETCGLGGFRLDAVKHMSADFLNDWIDHMRNSTGKDFFIVGENWNIEDVGELQHYLEITDGRMQLFDSLLHHNFYVAGQERENYDLSKIFDNTLVQVNPELAVTFVDNHDTQPLQALESYVEFWFRPLAYAIILLREAGIPCLFYTDLYDTKYTDKDESGEDTDVELVALSALPEMMRIRKDLAYGEQRDYLDFPSCIGWTRAGLEDMGNSGIAVLMSNGGEGFKEMEMGAAHAGKLMRDALGIRQEEIRLDENGKAAFLCDADSVSVWIFKEEQG